MKLVEMKSPRLEKIVKEGIGGAYGLLQEQGAFLAGGAITSLFCNREITDFDIYLPSKKAVFNLIWDIYEERDTNLWINHVSRKAILTKDNSSKDSIPLQFILCQFADTVENIFKAFDFTICMGAYDFAKEVFVLHEDFLIHNSQRVLKFNTATLYPIISLLRVDKYRTKGYTISKPDLIRIALTCSKLNLTSWDQVEDQLGGMYGLEARDVFDTDQTCSVGEVIEQLEHVQIDFNNYNLSPSKPLEEEGLLNYLFKDELAKIDNQAGEEASKIPVFEEGKYYKCVGSDWRSAGYYSNKIHYALGSVVNGGSEGIFVHADPKAPAHPSGYLVNWVELSPRINPTKAVRSGSNQLQIYGDFEVTKQFIYDPKGQKEPSLLDKLYDFFNGGQL